MPFINYQDSVVNFDGDLTSEDHEKLKNLIETLQKQEKERLSNKHPDRPWWPQTVFLARDIKSVCTLLVKMDLQDVANLLADMIGKTIVNMLDQYYPQEEVAKMLEEITSDADELDLITERELGKLFKNEQTQ